MSLNRPLPPSRNARLSLNHAIRRFRALIEARPPDFDYFGRAAEARSVAGVVPAMHQIEAGVKKLTVTVLGGTATGVRRGLLVP